MDHNELLALKQWFDDYCSSFSTPVEEDQRNFAIKQYHTRQVCLNALRIAGDLGLGANETLLAEAIALFHDVGRFPQYRRFKTFDDGISVNHAAIGAKVLLDENVLHRLPDQERTIILRAVTLHNVFMLPPDLDQATLLLSRLIRDADKLDILRVVIEYFYQDEHSRAEAVALGLKDTTGYSEKVLASLKRGEMARKSDLTNLNDFKLLQLAWLYDLNFSGSLRIALERDYIDELVRLLPATDAVREAADLVRSFVSKKLRAVEV